MNSSKINLFKRPGILPFSYILLINFIFCYVYSARISQFSLAFSILYLIVLILIFVFQKKLASFRFLNSDKALYVELGLYILIFLVLLLLIPVENLKVDRWSVITSFWDAALKGKYPYSAVSHMGNYPGPLPFYFILVFPFYLIGEIGYLNLLSFVLFVFFLKRRVNSAKTNISVLVLLLSVAIAWEIIVRSTILFNALIFLFYLDWIRNINFKNSKAFVITAVLAGLILSTRTIFAIPLALLSAYLLKSAEMNFRKTASWLIVAFMSFALTFSPFLLFNYKEFIFRNPFIIQTEFVFPFEAAVVILLLSISLGFRCKNRTQVLKITGWLFALIFVIYSILVLMKTGRSIDLSYSLFAFPFLLYDSFRKES